MNKNDPSQNESPQQESSTRKAPKRRRLPAQVASLDSEIVTDQEERPARGFLIFNAIPSWLASFLLNLSLILILALLAITTEKKRTLNLEATEIANESLEDTGFTLDDLKPNADDPLESDLSEPPTAEFTPSEEMLTIDTELTTDNAMQLASDLTSFEGDLLSELSTSEFTSEISGRSDSSRQQLLQKYGGNAASENAVELALQWIADHQLPDGGWNLNHTLGPPVNNRPRTSPNPGEMVNARMGATALALLPFLANGQTHRSGKYKKVVFDGLKFLMERPVQKGKGISYWDDDGNMYSHGLVAIVFNECYMMTRDERLRDFAQGTIYLIEDYQDPVGGGWRYERREPGDTSVAGWQLMAMKSAKMAGLEVNQRTFKLAQKFLDSVSTDYGAYYGYLAKPDKTDTGKFSRNNRARTAVGLLSRMYLGWDRERDGIINGVKWLEDEGPDIRLDQPVNMYYNYYATQLMKHYGGETWRKWNIKMRDFLVANQEQQGPAKGSWFFNPDGQYQGPGGRLYVTSLACLTLEVYYRYLPLYSEKAADGEFPLD